MKILYLTKGDHVDYQNDCLLIGLKELFGSSVVDINKQQHNYTSFNEEQATKLYGKGMTVTRVLEDLNVDRSDITSKIKNKYFDFVVYGSVWRCSDYFDQIYEIYGKKIILVDGEDHSYLHNYSKLQVPYFKRELIFDSSSVFPISFAMPTSKGCFEKTQKIKEFSNITPLNPATYVYNNEADYYKDYQTSYFGETKRKAGWDCLRHYEILGNGCIPYFFDIDKCPNQTMIHFPKTLCINVIESLKKEKEKEVYEKFINKFESYFNENNTTLALAKYFVNTIKNL